MRSRAVNRTNLQSIACADTQCRAYSTGYEREKKKLGVLEKISKRGDESSRAMCGRMH